MWKDPEWSESMKNALTNLWGKYAETGRYIREVQDAKEKYANLIADVHNWITTNEKIVISDYLKTKEGSEVDVGHDPSLLDYINETAKRDLLHLAEEKKRHQREIAKHHLEKVARMKSQGKE